MDPLSGTGIFGRQSVFVLLLPSLAGTVVWNSRRNPVLQVAGEGAGEKETKGIKVPIPGLDHGRGIKSAGRLFG